MLTPIKQKISRTVCDYLKKTEEEIIHLFEVPKSLAHGHICLPVFQSAKALQKKPNEIAEEVKKILLKSAIEEILKIETIQGFVNIYLKPKVVLDLLFSNIKTSGDKLGYQNYGHGKTVIIDYSSPNVAKPMHIGHLRSTVIGQAIRNLAQTQGYKVIGLNHLGDWGVQFGKLCFAYKKWGHEFAFEKDPFESLYNLYVRFHAEVEKDPELESEGAKFFKKLEDGDAELLALWKKFIEISMQDFNKLWKRLGIQHDLVRGESFYNDRLKPVEKELEDKKLLVESEGAMVVDLSNDKMPPCLIRKSDGASLYATRDIASAIYKMKELQAHTSLYVVGAEQNLHFKQVFKVLEKMGYAWSKNLVHISFGLIRFKDAGKISSRKGQIIRLSDVLDRARELVEKIIQEKNPNLANAKEISEQVAVGAIIFNDLVNERVKDIEFDWERVLSFEGDSGPYVQYVHVRCESILRKWGKPVSLDIKAELTSGEESELIRILLNYSDILKAAYQSYKPNLLANYLLDVCAAFNRFYNAHRILGGDENLQLPRLALVVATRDIIKSGLKVLNIKAPSEM